MPFSRENFDWESALDYREALFFEIGIDLTEY